MNLACLRILGFLTVLITFSGKLFGLYFVCSFNSFVFKFDGLLEVVGCHFGLAERDGHELADNQPVVKLVLVNSILCKVFISLHAYTLCFLCLDKLGFFLPPLDEVLLGIL